MIGCIGTKSEGKSDVCIRDAWVQDGCAQSGKKFFANPIPALSVVIALVLTGCSSVPDSVNPSAWFESDDAVVANSAAASDEGDAETETAPQAPPQGLLADRSNAKYADTIRREVAPTKPLARRTPAPAETQIADTKPVPVQTQTVPAATQPQAAPAPAPAPAQLTPVQPAPAQPAQPLGPDARAPVDRTQPVARDLGPAQPPASVNMVPPPPADIPATIADPLRRPKLVQSQFEKRLSESAQTTVRPNVVDMSNTGGYASRVEEAPIHLIPPSAQRKLAAARPAPQQDGPAATFQVAALDFQAGSATLTSADRTAIADVARLYRETGGMVRVVGIAPSYVNSGTGDLSQASIKRANAVARELARRGVPAAKILVGADPSPGFGDPVGARIYLDVI